MTQALTPEERLTWALLAGSGVGAGALRRLQQWLGNNDASIVEFWRDLERLAPMCGWRGAKIQAMAEWRQHWDAEKLDTYLRAHGWRVSYITDEDYPALLRFIPDFAPVLFYQGELTALSRLALAVVGSRRISAYGQAVVRALLAAPLAEVTVVSGLMTGVDEAAHRQALALGWPTVAFLGYGLEYTWPKNLTELRAQIVASGGAVVSEFPPWTQPRARHFPQRNRLVAGASAATLVVEAAARSGSLITAHLALDYGREVLSVPGSIFSETSVGCLDLIKKGATPVTSAAEVVQAILSNKINLINSNYYDILYKKSIQKQSAAPTGVTPAVVEVVDPVQARVLACLAAGPQDTESLSAALGTASDVLTALSWLELTGEIERGSDGCWRVVRAG